jgi:hypothetical protein
MSEPLPELYKPEPEDVQMQKRLQVPVTRKFAGPAPMIVRAWRSS